MKEKRFTYTKKNGERKSYDVMVIADGPDYLAAIDFNKLTEEEAKEVMNIQKEYEEKLKPYMKAYRNFIKENIEE
jgi:hypothetical protein